MWKRMVGLMLAAFLLLGAAQAEGMAELRRNTPERWQKTYTTPWRTIEVDAEVRLPDTDRAPVVLVGCGVNRQLSAPEGWDEISIRPELFRTTLQRESKAYPRSLNGRRLNQNVESQGILYEGFSEENAYIPMSETTFGEVCAQIEQALTQAGCDPQAYAFANPVSLSAEHMFFYGYKQDALPGRIRLTFRPVLAGLPVLGHVLDAVDDNADGMRADEYRAFPQCSALYSGHEERLTALSVWQCSVVETVAEEVSLVGFDRVIAAIEPEIEAGRVRKVYEIEFGYLLCNEPGIYHSRKTALVEGRDSDAALQSDKLIRDEENASARYYAKPVWQINTLWADGPRAALRDGGQTRNSLDYRCFWVDAQTGELLKASGETDRAEYDGFLP